MIEATVKNKKADVKKLTDFGFAEENGMYIYSTELAGGQMEMRVAISQEGRVYTEVVDNSSGEEYVLHRVPGAGGPFVGQIKEEHGKALEEILEKCFAPDVFKSGGAKMVIAYVRGTYGDELEFLWKRFPENAVWRRKDTGKWYGALLTVARRKLGMDSDEAVNILDLRIRPEDIARVVDNERYFPGYHMNKKHWYTICLDGSVPLDDIYRRIDESYRLAVK